MCCIRKHLKVVKHSVTINITEHEVPTRQRKQLDETRRYTGVTLYSRPITSMTRTVGEMYNATREVHQATDSIYSTTEPLRQRTSITQPKRVKIQKDERTTTSIQ